MLKRSFLALSLFIATDLLAQDSSIVYFQFNKYDLASDSRQTLEKFVNANNSGSFAIYGHADQLGRNGYNDTLSMRRAIAVKDFLVSNGLSENTITVVKGFGAAKPVLNDTSESSRQANRRVTIVRKYAAVAKDVVSSTTTASLAVKEQTNESLTDELQFHNLKEGQNIVLRNINFEGGRHIFLPQAYRPLEDLCMAMKKIPTLEIEIQGHICCYEGDEDGMDFDTGEPILSVNRARAVYEQLVRRGIDKTRMSYKGYGHKYPLVKEEITEEDKTINRRVEIKIMKK